jgi:hypothetical protein
MKAESLLSCSEMPDTDPCREPTASNPRPIYFRRLQSVNLPYRFFWHPNIQITYPSSIAYAVPKLGYTSATFCAIFHASVLRRCVTQPPRPISKLEERPLSAVRADCLLNIFAAIFSTWRFHFMCKDWNRVNPR